MATLGLVNLGHIQSETQTKTSNLFQQPIPGTDSQYSILIDIMGVSRTIDIDGIYEDAIVSNVASFITIMEGYCDGAQDGLAYVGDLITTSKNVFINSFSWNYVAADPNKISYTLQLIEGAA